MRSATPSSAGNNAKTQLRALFKAGLNFGFTTAPELDERANGRGRDRDEHVSPHNHVRPLRYQVITKLTVNAPFYHRGNEIITARLHKMRPPGRCDNTLSACARARICQRHV